MKLPWWAWVGYGIAIAFIIIGVCTWKYSGSKQVVIESIGAEEITMTNGSIWTIYSDDWPRAETWQVGDEIKLIAEPQVYPYNYLLLNLTRDDVVWARCMGDGR